MTQKPRLNLTISKEMYRDIRKRDKFNMSAFTEKRYREEFMNEEGLRANLEELDKKREFITKKLSSIAATKTIIPKADSKRCPVCTMFFNEDISIRKKTHVYKTLYVCKECSDLQKIHVDKLVQQMKQAEQEDENGE